MSPKNPRTAELRELFVSNLKRLMEERGLSPLETARKAAITDTKRFYRWASKGIARATHEHQQDLERLRLLFFLPSIGAFWHEGRMLSLHERIEEAGKIDWTYAYAFKVLVVLRAEGKTELKDLLDVVDGLFSECTAEKGLSAADVLNPRTPSELLSDIQINSPAAHCYLTYALPPEGIIEWLSKILVKKNPSIAGNWAIMRLLKAHEDTLGARESNVEGSTPASG
jgi:hypothetical protein